MDDSDGMVDVRSGVMSTTLCLDRPWYSVFKNKQLSHFFNKAHRPCFVFLVSMRMHIVQATISMQIYCVVFINKIELFILIAAGKSRSPLRS